MDLRLKGHVALVTGGTRGIGRAVAETFAAEGCSVSICARTRADVDAAVGALERGGARAFGRVADVREAEPLKAWIDASAAALGGVDVLVLNASGGNAPGEAGWRASFEHDVLGAARGVEAALPWLERSTHASVVVVATVAAVESFGPAGPYGAMKAALVHYAGALARELAPRGIRVNAVSPGPIEFDGGAWDAIRTSAPGVYADTLAQIALGRMGRADEVAAQVVFLASPRAGFTTGTNVVIDGGITRRIQY